MCFSAEAFNCYLAPELLNNKYTYSLPLILCSDIFLLNAWYHTLIMVIYDKYLMTLRAEGSWANFTYKWLRALIHRKLLILWGNDCRESSSKNRLDYKFNFKSLKKLFILWNNLTKAKYGLYQRKNSPHTGETWTELWEMQNSALKQNRRCLKVFSLILVYVRLFFFLEKA